MINKRKIKEQKGVTLMALIVSVIILLIISIVVITNFRGEDISLINSVEEKANTYNFEKVKKEIELTTEKIKLKHSDKNDYNITDFCIELEMELRKHDTNSIVIENGTTYNVTYHGHTFIYNF